MPVASDNIWRVLYSISRYLFPLMAIVLLFLVLFFVLSDNASHRERKRDLPGYGTVGEFIVLSGGKNLDVNTWFPVPREGVLGSIRSCDLVIPCPGVRPRHLDFSWEDGKGLLLFPRTGCEAFVNGSLITCQTASAGIPMTHGAVLQVGDAFLRLHLFAALAVTPVGNSLSDHSVQPDPFLFAPENNDSSPILPDISFQHNSFSRDYSASGTPDAPTHVSDESEQFLTGNDITKEDFGE